MPDDTPLALGISASDTLSCALQADGQLLTRAARPGERSAGMVAAFVMELVDQVGAQPNQIKELRVDIGPGSYTGLRAALAFAQMTAGFEIASLLTATSAELVAIAALEAGLIATGDCLLSLRDGTRKLILRTELCIAEQVMITDAPCAQTLDQLIEGVRQDHRLLAPSKLQDTLRKGSAALGDQLLTAPEYGAAQLFSDKLSLRPADPGSLEPLYLMGSYAE